MPSNAYAASVFFLLLPTPTGSVPSSVQAILRPRLSVTSFILTSFDKLSHLCQKSWM